MAAAKRLPKNFDPVADEARNCLKRAKGDLTKATQLMEAAVRGDPKLREALTEPLIAGACMEAVRRQMHGQRRSIWSQREEAAPPPTPAQHSARVATLAAGTLLMFPLPGGKPLGEATRDEVSRAATFYATQSKDMLIKAKWLQLICQSVPAGKTVAEVLSDRRLKELQAEARRASE